MEAKHIPLHTQVLVIGGGPSGSYAATCLAREGLKVVLLEADKFPRYHIGESMMATLKHFLRFIDLEQEFEKHGFIRKAFNVYTEQEVINDTHWLSPQLGGAFRLNRQNREGYTDFVSHDKSGYSWNLIRSQSDELMLRHASHSGVSVFEETRVTDIQFKDQDNCRNGLLSVKYLHNRKYNVGLKNMAMWGYWKEAGTYRPAPKDGTPFFEALLDQSGWAWFIPLHDGTASIGIVMNQDIYNTKKKTQSEVPKNPNTSEPSRSSLVAHYLSALQLAPDILKIIGAGSLVEPLTEPTIRVASDYSYAASDSTYAGPGYRIVGDAAAFIDPFFSSGVHLALSSGLSAAASICAELRGDCNAEEASLWHSTKVGTSYTRFLIVVLSAYRQMRAQEYPVLSDVDEDNFDRAFDHFRPVIQGHSDVSMSEFGDQLKHTIDFCAQAFSGVKPESVSTENSDPSTHKRDGSAQALPEPQLTDLDQAAKQAFDAQRGKMIQLLDNLITDEFVGHRLRLGRGTLGLDKVL